MELYFITSRKVQQHELISFFC